MESRQVRVTEVLGLMPYASNTTLLSHIESGELVVYKPDDGERPLWDFPSGLYQREVAAFVMSDDLGWDLVPPTVVREDGPADVGSVQLFVPCVFEEHYFTLHEAGREHDEAFRRICALDIVINNTDRKSGHCLLGTDDRIWAIDHGVAFHQQFKLRTVLWDFAGEPLPADIADDLRALLERGLPAELGDLLDAIERDAVLARTAALVEAGRFPSDDSGGHRWPWPLV